MVTAALCISEVISMKVRAEDESLHLPPPTENPLWIESYAFNGYDPVRGIGVTIYRGVKPVSEVMLETVTLHSRDHLLFFRNQEWFKGEYFLESCSMKIEPLFPLKKWKIQAGDFFQKVKNGTPSHGSEEVELDLYFDSHTPPYRYSTNRGNRYEQPGSLRGTVRIGDELIDFEGRGIRDHSWEIRNVPAWEAFYWLMGCFRSGEAVSFTYMRIGSNPLCHGWLRTEKYHEIHSIQVNPVFSGDVVKKCRILLETSEKERELNIRTISFIPMPAELISFVSLPAEQRKGRVIESSVELDGGEGKGFMWYGR